jgi:hypothetical protein
MSTGSIWIFMERLGVCLRPLLVGSVLLCSGGGSHGRRWEGELILIVAAKRGVETIDNGHNTSFEAP